jgi:PAS domain S-box-containing protein
MIEKETLSNPENDLRRLAEIKAAGMHENLEALSQEEARRILHELRVYQIELEMQNEELLNTQLKLNASRQRYFNFYDMAPVGYCTISEKGLILEANFTVATLLGITREALVRQPITRFIHREDQNIYYLRCKQLLNAHSASRQSSAPAIPGQTGVSEACELRMVKSDGTIFWAHLLETAAKDDEGAPVISIMISDISERKSVEEVLRLSEERFRKLFERHSAVKLVIDPDTGNIVDANEAAAQFYGWPLEELKRMRIQQIHLLPSEAMKAEMEKAASLESGRFEFRHRRADNSIRDVEIFSNRIEIAGKSLLYSIVHDISERKRAEASLRESEEALRRLLSQKEMLLKEVHHRVKNNLQVISSLISLQTDKLPDENARGGLRDVRDRVQTITLVHEMLHQSDDLAQLDFAEYAASLLQYLWRAHGAAAEKVRLSLSMAPLMLPADAAVPCGLILNELISNAFKHAFPGGDGEIAVTLTHDPAAGAVCLRVRDNGVGLHADFNWRQSGTLGLPLVQMLANQIHGSVQSVTGSDLGSGTEFRINFKI